MFEEPHRVVELDERTSAEDTISRLFQEAEMEEGIELSEPSGKVEQRKKIAELYGKAFRVAKEKLGEADPGTMKTRDH